MSDEQVAEVASAFTLNFFVSPYLAATCSVLHEDASKDTLIVDPGLDTANEVLTHVSKLGLKPKAILLTHGHLDHVADASRLAAELKIPVFTGAGDEYRLENPIEQLPPAFTGNLLPLWEEHGWAKPEAVFKVESVRDSVCGVSGVVEFASEATRAELNTGEAASSVFEPAAIQLGAITLHASQFPGHTEGSTIYTVCGEIKIEPLVGVSPRALQVKEVAFTGDVLFAGTIGRTDLPGGNPEEMKVTLAKLKQEALANAETLIVPGHGMVSTLGQELVDNRFLQMFG